MCACLGKVFAATRVSLSSVIYHVLILIPLLPCWVTTLYRPVVCVCVRTCLSLQVCIADSFLAASAVLTFKQSGIL